MSNSANNYFCEHCNNSESYFREKENAKSIKHEQTGHSWYLNAKSWSSLICKCAKSKYMTLLNILPLTPYLCWHFISRQSTFNDNTENYKSEKNKEVEQNYGVHNFTDWTDWSVSWLWCVEWVVAGGRCLPCGTDGNGGAEE